MKIRALSAKPSAVLTMIGPVVAPLGTVVLISVAVLEVIVADVPLKLTPLASLKFLPVMVTGVPGVPVNGAKSLMVGGGLTVTVKGAELVAVPPAVVTVIGPVVAPAGTAVTICVAVLEVIVADAALNLTLVTLI